MNSHPYLRAFLAGAFVPTLILPLLLLGFILLRLVLQVPLPFERGLVFPMALVPSLWAVWNMVWLGSRSDEEAADLALERDAILVPTRFIIDRLVRVGKESGIADYAYRKAVAINEQHRTALHLAVRKGVRIATGSDIYTSTGGLAGWGLNGHEVGHLVEAGMTPLRAIEAGTANGPLTLGPQAPKSGQLVDPVGAGAAGAVHGGAGALGEGAHGDGGAAWP